MSVPILLRFSAGLLWLSTFGLGIPCLMAIRNLSAGLGIPYVFGYPAYGGGAFERHGLLTSIPLLLGFLFICFLDGWAGWLVWNGQKSGALMTFILLIPEAVYWWGFDLPFPPIAALVRTILIIISWASLV